jgi:molybdate transport system permease protein
MAPAENRDRPTDRNRPWVRRGVAYGFLSLFLGAALSGIATNLAGWEGTTRFFTAVLWISLPLYFITAALSIDPASRSGAGRIFFAGTFLFLAAFVTFAWVLILSDAFYVDQAAVIRVATSPFITKALNLSITTSVIATAFALLFAIPMGYALSRHPFPGRILADTLVDIPIVFPPLVAGLTLLIFFNQTDVGRWIEEDLGMVFVFQAKGIVLCQFVVSASFAIRSIKTAFDEVDRRLENVALTLGFTPWRSFLFVSLPLARGGIMAGAVLAWARAFGIFGPLMIFVGSFRGKTEVLSTTIYLEQSVGNLEVALAVSLLLILVALVALVTIRLAGGRSLVKL